MTKVGWVTMALLLAGCGRSGIHEVRSSRSYEAVDLVGIRPGMTFPEVLRSLKERYPTYNFSTETDISAGRSYVNELDATPGNSDDLIRVEFTGPHSGNKAVVIQRRQFLRNTNRVLASTLATTLKQKYSADFNENSDKHHWFWIFGGKRESSDLPCGRDSDLISPLAFYSPECGVEVIASEPTGDQDGYVDQIEIRVVDHIAGYAARKLDQKAQDEFDGMQRASTQDPNRKPDL